MLKNFVITTILAFAGLLLTARPAQAELVTYVLTASNDEGESIKAHLSFHPNTPPSWARDYEWEYGPGAGGAEFMVREAYPVRFFAELDGRAILATMPRPDDSLIEFVVSNNWYWSGWDSFGLSILGSPQPRFLFALNLSLRDDTGTAFDEYLRLPHPLVLSAYNHATIDIYLEWRDRPNREYYYFSGTIDSLRLIPEPSSVTLCGLATLLGLASWGLRRRLSPRSSVPAEQGS